ncbi:MAG: tRNA lysidine(34) synthetase TilS [Candidatus Vidania fulgoroideorum]
MKIKNIKNIKKNIKKGELAIAFSGGIDSNYLINIFLNKKLKLIHINHNTNKKCIKNKYICKKIAEINKIKIFFGEIKINKKKIKKYGFECVARIERYKKILEICKKKKIKMIILGHNFNDYIETIIMNIFRGTNLYGINSFKYKFKMKKIVFIRPILKYNKEYIIKNVKKPKLIAIDETNNKNIYFRNIIRKYLNKIIKKQNKNKIQKNIKKFIKNTKENIKLTNELAKIDINKTKLKIKKLKNMKETRIRNILTYIIKKDNKQIPSRNWLKEITKQIKTGKHSILIKKNKFKLFVKNKKIKIK